MRQSKLTIGILCVALGLLSACTKEKREAVTGSSGVSSSGPATLSTIQNDVFRLGCAVTGCHDNRAKPAANLNMVDVDSTYSNLITRNSIQAINAKLIVPGDPDNSYLIAKLRGTHLSMGGSGDRMPQYAAMLSDSDLERIVQWVADGADRN